MVTPKPASPEPIEQAREFLASFASLHLATCNANTEPLASYAPFALIDGCFALLLSDLAAHTGNLRAVPRASIMLLEDEQDTSEIFARRRLICQCSVTMHPAGSSERNTIVDALKQRHGETVDTLAALPDFHGVLLKPESASFVAGFARAHTLPPAQLFNDKG